MGLPDIHSGQEKGYVQSQPLLHPVLDPHAPILPRYHKTSFGGCQRDTDRAPITAVPGTSSNGIDGIGGAVPAAESSKKQELSCTKGNVALGRSWEGCCRLWDRGGQP